MLTHMGQVKRVLEKGRGFFSPHALRAWEMVGMEGGREETPLKVLGEGGNDDEEVVVVVVVVERGREGGKRGWKVRKG
jgi:hypothetical protein